MGAMLQAKVSDLATVSKHVRVRRNKVERAKLDYLDAELGASPRLVDVETEVDFFENSTSQDFTNQMTHQFN